MTQQSLFEQEVQVQDTRKPLRPRQVQGIKRLFDEIRAGHKHIGFQAPPGFGKTRLAAELISMGLAKGLRPLFTCPAISLIDQSLKSFENEGIHDIGVMQSDHSRTNRSATVQIASVQTLLRRSLPDVGLIIVDECFPAGTMVSTSRGPKPIEKVVPGEMIPNALGIGRVLSLFRKSHNQFVTVRLSDGSKFRCTPDHPIFTLSGWKKAGELEVRQRLFREEDVRLLRERVRAIPNTKGIPCGDSRIRGGILKARVLLQLLLEEATESYVTTRSKRTGIPVSSSERIQAKVSGRKRKAHAGDSIAGVGYIGRRLVSGARSQNAPQATDVSALLQAGSGQPDRDDRDRTGWWESFVAYATGAGSEKGCIAPLIWVEGIETEERPCAEPVYNLRVAGHPSYFANGVLVHNCHERFEGLEKLMAEEWADKIVIGLSATPWSRGLGLHYSSLVIGATFRDMEADSLAREYTIWGPEKDVERGDLAIKAGEFEEKGAAARMSEPAIVGDVLKEWRERSTGEKTFAFCVNRDHARVQMEAFQDCGIPFGYIDANTPVGENDNERGSRKFIFKQMQAGEIAGIASVGCLIRGVDEVVYNILDLQLTKSEIRHVQKWGRMRTSDPNATYVGLDHAGNNQNLGHFMDIYHETLDSREPGDKKEAYEAEHKPAKPRKCPKCHCLVPAGSRNCPSCNDRMPLYPGVIVKDGKLVEMKPAPKLTREQSDWLRELKWIANKSGFKNGWVRHSFEEKFGLKIMEVPQRGKRPTDEVRAFAREKRKAYLAEKKAREATDSNSWKSGACRGCGGTADRLCGQPCM